MLHPPPGVTRRHGWNERSTIHLHFCRFVFLYGCTWLAFRRCWIRGSTWGFAVCWPKPHVPCSNGTGEVSPASIAKQTPLSVLSQAHYGNEFVAIEMNWISLGKLSVVSSWRKAHEKCNLWCFEIMLEFIRGYRGTDQLTPRPVAFLPFKEFSWRFRFESVLTFFCSRRSLRNTSVTHGYMNKTKVFNFKCLKWNLQVI